jgi:TP901 family phage tail tape measure protein
MQIGTIEGVLRLRDEFSTSLNRAGDLLRQSASWPRGLQSSLADLERQMKKVAATPALRPDAAKLAQYLASTKASTRALEEEIATLKKGPAALSALNREREVMARLVAAGVTRESAYGRQVEQSIRLEQQQRQTKADLAREMARLPGEYRKVSNELDTTDRNTRKLANSEDVLRRSLAAGLITQDQFNRKLDEAKRKFNDTSVATDKYRRELTELGGNLQTIGGGLTRTVSVPLAAIGALSIKAASDFESSFADIRKTADGVVDSFGNLTALGSQLSQEMRNLSKEIPVNVNELNKLGGVAGQLGIETPRIVEFTKTVAALGVATNLTAEQAAIGFAKISSIAGLPQDQFDRLGSSVVALGNNFETTEADITEYSLRIAGAGKISGLAVAEITAIGAAMSSVGVEAEAGGTAIQKVLIGMTQAVATGGKDLQNFAAIAGKSASEFATLWKTDAAEAFTLFVEGLGKSGDKAFVALEALGLTDQRLVRGFISLAGAGDKLRTAIDLSTQAFEENTALAKEAEQRYKTFESQLKLFWGAVKDVGITIGQALIPILRDMLAVLGPILKGIAILATGFAALPTPIRLVILVFAGLLAAVGPVLFVAGQLIQSWTVLIALSPTVAARLVTVRLALLGLAGVFTGVVIGLTAFNYFLGENKRLQKEYQDALVKSNSLLVESRKRHLNNADALFIEAKATVKVLEANLQRQKSELESLSRVNPYYREDTSGAEQERARGGREKRVQRDLADTERALADAREAYVKLEDARSKIAAPPGLGDALDVKPLNLSTAATEKLTNRLAELRAELIRNAAQNREIVAGLGRVGQVEKTETERRIEGIKRSHALHNAYLSDVAEFGAAAAKSLQALRAADYDTAKAAEEAQTAYENLKGAVKTLDDRVKSLANSFKAADSSKLKADADNVIRVLREIKSLELDADFAIRLSGIEEATPALEEIERQWLELLRSFGNGSIEAGEAILVALAKSLGKTIDEIKGHLQTIQDSRLAEGIRGSSITPTQAYRTEVSEVERLVKAGVVSVADGQAKINSLTKQHWNDQLSEWSSALGFLSDQFGGFFTYLNQLVNGLQQAQQFGQSISSITSSFGASSSTASAAGALGAAFAVWAIAYDLIDQMIEKNRSRRFGNVAEFGRDNGGTTGTTLDETSQELFRTIRTVVEGLEDALGISIQSLETIGLRLRNDGNQVQAYIEGELIGVFDSVEEAIEAALRVALQDSDTIIAGLSDLMRQGLSEFTPPDFDELVDFLGQLREISDLGLSQGVIGLRETVRHLDGLWATLTRLREVTPAVVQGFNNIAQAEARAWQALFDSITGRQRSNAEILEDKKRELVIAKIELDLRRASIKQRIIEIQAMIAQLRAGNILIGGGGGRPDPTGTRGGGNTGGFSAVTSAMIGLAQASTIAAVAVSAATSGISDAALAMIAALEEELAALERLLEALPEPPDASEIRLPDGTGGGGRGGSDRSNVLEFVRNRTFELNLTGMSDYQRALTELERQYEELIEQAGRDQTLRAEVIALREREIALLNQEKIRATIENFREFMGLINPFDRVRQTAADLIRQIEESPLGDARKMRMIGRLVNELNRQLDQLAREMAAGLFAGLAQDLERFGADETLLFETRRQMAILEHVLKMEQYRAQIAILRAEGRLAPEVLAALQRAFDFLQGVDPTSILTPGSGDKTPQEIARERARDRLEEEKKFLADIIAKARESLKKYQETGLDPLTKNLVRIVGDFRSIRGALGDTAEVMSAYARAVNEAIQDFLEPIREVQRDLFFGDTSPADTLSQWARVQADFAAAQARFRAGDLSVVGSIPDLVQQLLGIAQQVTPIGSQAYTDIFTSANEFLNEVLALSPDTLGSIANPTHVEGMTDLTLLTEEQLVTLNLLLASSQGVLTALLNRNAPNPLASVA